MKMSPVSLLSLALIAAGGVISAMFGRFDIGVLLGVLAIGLLAIQTMAANRRQNDDPQTTDLGNEDQAKLSPLRRLKREIQEIVESKASDPTISVVGNEALRESERIYDQCAQLLLLRRELNKAFVGRSAASRELEHLERDLNAATSEAERAALESALAARKLESEHYAKADQAVERIEAGLRQAQAALSEMKARLATVSAGETGAGSELEDTLGRLRTLGTSLDEAEAWLRS